MLLVTSVQIAQTDLGKCYTEFTEVSLNKQKQEICVKLQTANNARCAVLPRGVRVDARLDKLSAVQTAYLNTFNYSATDSFCFACENCGGTGFETSSYIQVNLSTVNYVTSVNPGIVYKMKFSDDGCFHAFRNNSFRSVLEVQKNRITFRAAANGICPITQQISAADLSDYKIELNYVDYMKEGYALQQTFQKDGASTVQMGGGYITVSMSGPNFYNHFNGTKITHSFVLTLKVVFGGVLRTLTAKTHVFVVTDAPKGYDFVSLNINPVELQVTSRPNELGKQWGQRIVDEGGVTSSRMMFVSYDTDGPIQTSYPTNEAFSFQALTNYFFCNDYNYKKRPDLFELCRTNVSQVFDCYNRLLTLITQAVTVNGEVAYLFQYSVDHIQRGCIENAEVYYYQTYITMHFFYAENYPTCFYNLKQKVQIRLIISNATEVYIKFLQTDKVMLKPRTEFYNMSLTAEQMDELVATKIISVRMIDSSDVV